VTKVAFLFPGQGSAVVGMGDSIAGASPAAASVLDRLGDLAPEVEALRRDGPLDALIPTSNAQPAILAVNCACAAALEECGVRPDIVAGHSLGEYTALVAAGVLDFDAGLPLVLQRGALMERSASAAAGTMSAVLGSTPEAVEEIIARWQERGVIANANDNAPGQIVVSGDVETLRAAADDFRAAGARVIDLPVGGAFHSPLMADAERAFGAVLDATPFAEAHVPVISNLTATPATDPATVKDVLRRQITGRVRWRESIAAMQAFGVDTFVEVGPGKVLSGLVQRCTRGQGAPVRILNVEDAASLEKTLATLSASA
jgi:[acyl-carrier-protein] S-malonyltransferase